MHYIIINQSNCSIQEVMFSRAMDTAAKQQCERGRERKKLDLSLVLSPIVVNICWICRFLHYVVDSMKTLGENVWKSWSNFLGPFRSGDERSSCVWLGHCPERNRDRITFTSDLFMVTSWFSSERIIKYSPGGCFDPKVLADGYIEAIYLGQKVGLASPAYPYQTDDFWCLTHSRAPPWRTRKLLMNSLVI